MSAWLASARRPRALTDRGPGALHRCQHSSRISRPRGKWAGAALDLCKYTAIFLSSAPPGPHLATKQRPPSDVGHPSLRSQIRSVAARLARADAPKCARCGAPARQAPRLGLGSRRLARTRRPYGPHRRALGPGSSPDGGGLSGCLPGCLGGLARVARQSAQPPAHTAGLSAMARPPSGSGADCVGRQTRATRNG